MNGLAEMKQNDFIKSMNRNNRRYIRYKMNPLWEIDQAFLQRPVINYL